MTLDQKTIARIDSLYSNAKLMPLLCIIGIVIPFVLLIGALLGILYWFWRKALLRELDSQTGNPSGPPPLPSNKKCISTDDKITYLREAKLAFLAPGIVFICYAAIIAGMIAFLSAGSQ
jgi:hypothetical protein